MQVVMVGELFLHVRKLPSGRLIGTPIPFTDLSFDGDSLNQVCSRAREAAIARLEDMPGLFRATVLDVSEAVLESVEVKVSGAPGSEVVGITVGLVVLEQAATTGRIHVAYAPGVPRWSATARTRQALLGTAVTLLEEQFKHWPPGSALALDQLGEVSLERLRLAPAGDQQEPPQIQIPGDDMVELSRQGRLGRLDRRDLLVERVLAALAADGRASVLLVGQSDVGKTALVHEIAARLSAGEVPPGLRGRHLWRTSANELIAGAKFTGMWQDRARLLIAFARRSGAIVVMGDPSAIVDAGRWSESDNNLGRVLRPYVERGEIRLICETTEEGLAAARKWEPSFVEVFYRVDVPEPDPDAALEILRAAARRIEANQGAPFSEEALEAAVQLTRRFEPYRALPGKAVRLLEEAAQLGAGEPAQPLGREEITRAFAQRTGMPLVMLSDQIALSTQDVSDFFEQRVLGQPEAVEAVVDLIAVIKAALNDPSKPLSTMFFVGPTGVGKTELTKALAEFLFGSRDRVLRFDMGEYATGDAVARLTGSAWDRNGEGELTRRVREQPFCVVLLDELEKAHRSVFDALLPALGEGRLTDASGHTADLRNAIVIMTSNLGAERQGTDGVGFTRIDTGDRAERHRAHFVERAEAFFRPEFFNRIDRVLAFDPLSEETITRIARRELGRLLLREGITRRQLLVEIGDGVVEQLAAAGFHPRYGARPLHREIERAVIRPLARLIVEQRPGPGDLIRLEQTDDGIQLGIQRIREAEQPRPHRNPEEKHRDASLSKAVAGVEAVQQELHDSELSGPPHLVSLELSDLLERVNAPGFWDEPDDAQQILTRVYQLQRISDRFTHLRNRVDGLLELANQLRSNRDRTRLAELREALSEATEELALIQVECAGAVVGSSDPQVEMTFAPIGSEARDWADQLAALYAAWAERTGREVSRTGSEIPRLTIQGPGSLALLANEQGLHRRELPSRKRLVVRVTVDTRGGNPGRGSRNGAQEPAVVRIYSEGARTGVRDPRTGARVGNLQGVLHGHIDEFILAGVTHKEPA